MDRLRCRQAYTLVESLLSLFVLIIAVELSISIFSILLGFENQKIQPIEIFDVQIRQLLIRSVDVEVEAGVIRFSNRNEIFEIYRDGKRVVKRPGYEILLDNVTYFDGESVCVDEKCIEIKTR